MRVGCSGADGRYQPSAPLRWFRGWQLSGECINTSVLRCLDHFITSPDTAVYWILCVNFWYYRFPCSLDRQIPTEIIIFDFFPFQLNKLKKNWKSIDLRRFLAFGSRHATAWLQSRETLSTFIHDILLCNIHTQSRAQQFPNYENLCILRDYSGFSTFLFRYRKMLNIVVFQVSTIQWKWKTIFGNIGIAGDGGRGGLGSPLKTLMCLAQNLFLKIKYQTLKRNINWPIVKYLTFNKDKGRIFKTL